MSRPNTTDHATERTCKGCGETKPISHYYLQKDARQGRRYVMARCKPCVIARKQRWRDANRAESRAYYFRHNMRYLHGLTPEGFAAMLIEQSGRCAICAEPTTMPHVDHDHATGRIRGLLCQGCNLGIGHLQDDPARLRAAADYLS